MSSSSNPDHFDINIDGNSSAPSGFFAVVPIDCPHYSNIVELDATEKPRLNSVLIVMIILKIGFVCNAITFSAQ
ncbi:hypothetical protein HK096_007762, partial [Nowakowskiella sp. JEL0078]